MIKKCKKLSVEEKKNVWTWNCSICTAFKRNSCMKQFKTLCKHGLDMYQSMCELKTKKQIEHLSMNQALKI